MIALYSDPFVTFLAGVVVGAVGVYGSMMLAIRRLGRRRA